MRKCLTNLPVLLCCLFFTKAGAQVQKIYLQPKAPLFEKQSNLVDSIRFIPLRTPAGSNPGKFNYIIFAEKFFLLVDYPEKKIQVYEPNGTFVRTISYSGLGDLSPSFDSRSQQLVFFGPNRNYALTSRDMTEIRQDWSNPRNRKYFRKYCIALDDPEARVRREVPDEKDVLEAKHLYGDIFWRGDISTNEKSGDSVDYELKLYKGNERIGAWFPYNPVNEPRFLFAEEDMGVSSIGDSIFFVTRPFCDTIYRLQHDSVVPAFQLVMPLENSLPPSFFTRPFRNKPDRENFYRNNGWIMRRATVMQETSSFLFLNIQYLNNYESYIYNKRSQTGVRTKNIRPDSSQFNLGLLADYKYQRNGDRFYRTVQAGELLSFFATHKDILPPKELEAFLAAKPSADAPVIVTFKLKN